MPRNMSFALTPFQILNQSKTVTRRVGWKILEAGQLIQPVEKAMGIPKGGSIKKLGGLIRVTSIRTELLRDMPENDLAKEGFPDFTLDQFFGMLRKETGARLEDEVQRIEFEYLETLSVPIAEVEAMLKRCAQITVEEHYSKPNGVDFGEIAKEVLDEWRSNNGTTP